MSTKIAAGASTDSDSAPPPRIRAAALNTAVTASAASASAAASSSASPPARHSASNGSNSPTSSLRWDHSALNSSEMELSNSHRLLSASIGAVLTSIVVTPFDVVKTRLQSQINSLHPAAAAASGGGGSGSAGVAAAATARSRLTASQELLRNCSHFRLHTGLTDQWCANCFSYTGKFNVRPLRRATSGGRAGGGGVFAAAAAAAAAPPAELRFTGAIDAAVKLIRHEGATSLWRGLSPTLLMSIPSTVVYFSVYDKAKISLAALTPEYVEQHVPWLAPYTGTLQSFSPLLSGVFSRALTTTLVSPVELVRTKSQSLRTSSTMRELLADEMRRGGLFSLWRGVGPTLMRDVPFSAIYWTSYEYSKLWMLLRWGVEMDKQAARAQPQHKQEQDRQHFVYASFLAGAGSGMLSAAITHPFDLVKTRRQIELYALQEAHEHATPVTTITGKSYSHAYIHSAAYNHQHGPALAGAGGPSISRGGAASFAFSAATASGETAGATGLHNGIPSSTMAVLRTIVAEEGYIGLLSGLSARITKIAPACAIMISSYEWAKQRFGAQDSLEREWKQKARSKRE